MRGERWGADHGAVTPVMLAIIASLLFLSAGLFAVGNGASARAQSQTAADAAALAAAGELRVGLAGVGEASAIACRAPGPLGKAEAAARDYAERNGGELVRIETGRHATYGCYVDVWVRNDTAVTGRGPLAPDVDDETARGGIVRARAAMQGIALGTGGGGGLNWATWPGSTSNPDPFEDPESVAQAVVHHANDIAQAGYPYVWGGGHGQDPVQPGGPGYDCSASVSMLLQHAGIPVPTTNTGGYYPADLSPEIATGEGDFLTIWVFTGTGESNPGHIWLDIGGNGWGTHPSNPGGGPGWGHYAQPRPDQLARGAKPMHFPALEDGLDAGFIAGLAIPGSDSVGSGTPSLGPAGPRLLDIAA